MSWCYLIDHLLNDVVCCGACSEALAEAKIPLAKVVCFTTDGASVLTGNRNGVAAHLKAENPHLLLVHCVAQKLALGVANCFSQIPCLLWYDEVMEKLSAFFSHSPQRRERLRDIQEVLGKGLLVVLKRERVRYAYCLLVHNQTSARSI